ncbi:MAG: ATP-grasp domain-containing protein [Cellvibrionaceae bacterium]
MNKTGLGTCVLPFPDYQTVMSLADKGKLLTSAGAAGIPVPDYRLFNKAAEVAVEEFTSFPVVLKPCLSRIWTGQGWINTSVTMINNREELSRTLDRTDYLQRYPFMIQAFVPGHGAGLFALYDSGQPVAYFSHRRIREKPPRGGVSVVSESAPVDTQLQEYAEALLTRANWHGVAMVEFRVTDRGLPYLMEVNTRFWGSLQLAIDAGVDFPRLLWEITAGQAIEPQSEYRIGQRLRWLLGDLDSLYLALKDRDYSARQKLERLVGFLTPSFGHFRYEVNRWGDLKPAWFELRQYVKDLVR